MMKLELYVTSVKRLLYKFIEVLKVEKSSTSEVDSALKRGCSW